MYRTVNSNSGSFHLNRGILGVPCKHIFILLQTCRTRLVWVSQEAEPPSSYAMKSAKIDIRNVPASPVKFQTHQFFTPSANYRWESIITNEISHHSPLIRHFSRIQQSKLRGSIIRCCKVFFFFFVFEYYFKHYSNKFFTDVSRAPPRFVIFIID